MNLGDGERLGAMRIGSHLRASQWREHAPDRLRGAWVWVNRRDQLRETTGCDFGELPPAGRLFAIPLLFDKDLLQQDEIYFKAGSLSLDGRRPAGDSRARTGDSLRRRRSALDPVEMSLRLPLATLRDPERLTLPASSRARSRAGQYVTRSRFLARERIWDRTISTPRASLVASFGG
jgi:hypothetical protein